MSTVTCQFLFVLGTVRGLLPSIYQILQPTRSWRVGGMLGIAGCSTPSRDFLRAFVEALRSHSARLAFCSNFAETSPPTVFTYHST